MRLLKGAYQQHEYIIDSSLKKGSILNAVKQITGEHPFTKKDFRGDVFQNGFELNYKGKSRIVCVDVDIEEKGDECEIKVRVKPSSGLTLIIFQFVLSFALLVIAGIFFLSSYIFFVALLIAILVFLSFLRFIKYINTDKEMAIKKFNNALNPEKN